MSSSYTQRDQANILVRLLVAIYRWGFAAPFVVFCTVICGSLIVALCFFGAEKFASRELGKIWARLNSLACMIKVKTRGREKFDPSRSYVIVANHQSLSDILVIYGHIQQDIKWVMKKELRSVPVLGIACEKMGHIIVDRSNTEAALASINEARGKLTDGMSVVFFPEGTRSRDGELKTFKKGAFRLAQELNLPILPVAIHGTKDIIPSDTTDLWPGEAVLEFCEPIEPLPASAENLTKLSNIAKERIGNALKQA